MNIIVNQWSSRKNVNVIWSELVKNMKFLTAYPSVFVFWAIFPIFWFIPFIFEGQAFVGGLQSSSFEQVTGTADFVPFIVIGAILYSYVSRVIYGMGESIRREMLQGTLDYIFIAPSNKVFVLIGKALSETLTSSIFTVSQLLMSILLFGLNFSIDLLLPVFFIVILLVLGLHGIALVLAGLSLMHK